MLFWSPAHIYSTKHLNNLQAKQDMYHNLLHVLFSSQCPLPAWPAWSAPAPPPAPVSPPLTATAPVPTPARGTVLAHTPTREPAPTRTPRATAAAATRPTTSTPAPTQTAPWTARQTATIKPRISPPKCLVKWFSTLQTPRPLKVPSVCAVLPLNDTHSHRCGRGNLVSIPGIIKKKRNNTKKRTMDTHLQTINWDEVPYFFCGWSESTVCLSGRSELGQASV